MKRLYIVLIILVVAAAGCSKENVKPSPDSLLATAAFSRIEKIKKAYEAKDRDELRNTVSAETADSILKNLFFEKAELSFTPRLVRIGASSVTVNLNWRGTWWTAGDGKIEDRGVADLVLEKETMKLLRIEGDNPFQTPIAE
ncbi:MAG: hypothetical protein GXP46_12525 [Deferribacteres bacterium]|nr:hypothetical protein [Deferribacteres bacterium]